MSILRLDHASLSYGDVALLDGVDFAIDAGERVCLVGRNGEGKSTLMKVLSGQVQLDDGQVRCAADVRLAYLAQEVPANANISVFDVVAQGLEEAGRLISSYHQLSSELARSHDNTLMKRLDDLQHRIDACNGWQFEQQIEKTLSVLGLAGEAIMGELSGGFKRRVMLARALVCEPDLLLLDEPTNHLDIEAIKWMEDFLIGLDSALLFVTHDRAFLRRLATRIIELDRGALMSYPGDYDDYLTKKEHRLAVQAEHNAKFDKKLADEEVWIRQGIKARRTRNEGRVRALKKLREQRRARRERVGSVKMKIDDTGASSNLVIEAEDVSKAFAGAPVVEDFSMRVMRGDRIGIVGPNGAGKSTLLKLLLGELDADKGSVNHGQRLKVAYFDQHRATLDPEKSVVDNLNHGSDTVLVNDRSRHVIGYLQDFLFSPKRTRSPVKTLSGGEKNRLLLARLFLQPANVLVLDEPTNDLDVETLELLEELLMQFKGTVIVVSHDRAFLDNVVTSVLMFEGEGRIREYVGGYTDALKRFRETLTPEPMKNKARSERDADQVTKKKENEQAVRRKLSYKEKRELEALPERIEALELEQKSLETSVSQSDFYRGEKEEITRTLTRLESIGAELEACYERWELLME